MSSSSVSSVSNVQPGIDTQNVTNYVINDTYRLVQNIVNLQRDCDDFEKTPPEDTERADIENSLLDRTTRLIERKDDLYEDAKKLDVVARNIIEGLLKLADDDINSILDWGHVGEIFAKRVQPQIDELDKNVQALTEKVNKYASSRDEFNDQDMKEVWGLYDELSRLKKEPQYAKIDFNWSQKDTIVGMENDLAGALKALKQISENAELDNFENNEVKSEPSELTLLNNIQSLIDAGSSALSESDKTELNKRIDKIGEKFSNFIDGQIYALAPEPKGGDNWGKLHRFDDLNRFKQAFVNAFSEFFNESMNTEPQSPFKDDPEAQKKFYLEIYNLSSTHPVVDDQVAWARQNIIYNFDNIRQAIINVKAPQSSIEEQKDAVPVSPNVAALQNIKDLLPSASKMSDKGKTLLLKGKIMELSDDVRNSLFGGIWDLAEEYRKEEDKWGENHCCDNLVTLEIALDSQISRLKEQEKVAK